MNYQLVECHLIVVDVHQRRPLNEQAVKELAASIENDGLLHPITVRPDGNGKYRLVAGHHRLEAVFMILNRPTIAATILSLNDNEAEIIEIEENLRRNELTIEQRSEAIRRFAELQKLRHGDALSDKGGRGRVGLSKLVAQQLGVSKKKVERALRGGKVYLPPRGKEPPRPPQEVTPSELVDAGLKLIRANWTEISENSRSMLKAEVASLPGGEGEPNYDHLARWERPDKVTKKIEATAPSWSPIMIPFHEAEDWVRRAAEVEEWLQPH